ncbi:RNA polymerase sigma factor RpoH [Sulfurirhabdus autotrophica]|uniref:RNA polymerase sigma factor RpoH n=1 Tax=Sulfurirhabdus autotrophica TaxID=1706046 RepID=A0A4R3Y0H9_9PROT|nr:RNA polymerase sigma factor RpoH [Sulfurirhabdus autotrophica]TCV84741.1 RNA polymerase RpoH-like sigma 32 subunit [Sulfurirhabdus autotrophica]
MTQALAFPSPYSVPSLESYIHTVNSLPMLTPDEELNLGRRLKADNDVEAAHTLVLSHLRVVVNIARGYTGYGLPQADLIQEGNIGLMKAVKRFDPERGVRLVSFAVHWIRAEIHEFVLRNWRLVKIATTKAQRKLFFNLRSMKTGHGHLSHEEIQNMAKQLGVKPEEVTEMETRLSGQDISLEPVGDDEEYHYGPIAFLADPHAEPDQQLEAEESERMRSDGMKLALDSLDDRSRRIIEARWLMEKDSATLHDLASEFSVSAERIRQIEQKALQKMKTIMGAGATA